MRKLLAILLLLTALLLVFNLFGPAKLEQNATVEVPPKPRKTSAPTLLSRAGAPELRHPIQDSRTVGQRLFNSTNSEDHYLDEHQIARFLQQNGTNGETLVACFEVTGDKNYLREAAARNPRDPLVAAKVVMHNVFPEERLKWIENFKTADPSNSMGNFLALRLALQQGDIATAVKEVQETTGKRFNDYYKEISFGVEEAFLSAGRSAAEAKLLGSSSIRLPHLGEINRAGKQLVEAADQLRSSGDHAAALPLFEAVWQIGNQLKQNGQQNILINELVGIDLENSVLTRLAPGEQSALFSQPPQELMELNLRTKGETREGFQILGEWMQTASDHEVASYYDRLRLMGERNANNWVKLRMNNEQ